MTVVVPVGRAAATLAALMLIAGPGRAAESPPNSDNTDVTPTTDGEQKARTLMRDGLGEYARGNLEGARAAFEEAWRAHPHFAIAGSLAEVEMKLGRYTEAAEHWTYYLGHLPPGLSGKKTTAESAIAECRKHVASLRISASQIDAIIEVDGKPVGLEPLDAVVWVEPGTHTVEAHYEGRLLPPQKTSVAAGEDRQIRLEYPPQQPTPVLPVAPVGTPAHEEASRSNSWIRTDTAVLIGGGILTLAAIGTGMVFYLNGASEAREADVLQEQSKREGMPELAATNNQCSPPPTIPRPAVCSALLDKRDEQVRDYNLAIGSFIGAALLGAGTALAYLSVRGHRANSGPFAHFFVGPELRGTSSGVRVVGSF